MKFGHLIEYKMRKIFLEKPHTKCGKETNDRPSFRETNPSIYLNQQSEVSYNLFLLNFKDEDYQNILKLRRLPFAFSSRKAF